MSRWEPVVRQLGEQLGTPELTLGNNGQFAIALESGRRIAGEISSEDLLIYAYDPVPYDGAKRVLRAWRRTYMSRQTGRSIQTALSEQNNQLFLLAVTRLRANECSAYTMRAAIDLVSRWLDDTCSQ